MESNNKKENSPKPGAEHKLLNAFAGKWNTTGEVKKSSSAPAIPISGTDTYEWLSGKFFLIHRWNVSIGDKKHQGIEIIGYDADNKIYRHHSFNDEGTIGAMEASVNNGIWTFKGKTERCTVVFSDGGNSMTGNWEQTTDGINWSPWMEVRLTKVAN